METAISVEGFGRIGQNGCSGNIKTTELMPDEISKPLSTAILSCMFYEDKIMKKDGHKISKII